MAILHSEELTMAAHPSSLTSPVGSKGWVLAAGAALAGCGAILAVAVVSAPTGLLIGLAASRSNDQPATSMFDGTTAVAGAQLLRGVSGEVTVTRGGPVLSDTPEAAANAIPERDVAPAALDRLNAGDCIALTTTSGQKLSFRIVGAQPAEIGRKPGAANIELAVTPCAPGNEIVLKAIIESKAGSKESVIQRAL